MYYCALFSQFPISTIDELLKHVIPLCSIPTQLWRIKDGHPVYKYL